MRIKKMSKKPSAKMWTPTGTLSLFEDRIENTGDRKNPQPLDGVTARIESGSELEKRVTATRLVTMGLFALMAKKKSGGEVWLTVEGPSFFWSLKVDRQLRNAATQFASQVNQAARQS